MKLSSGVDAARPSPLSRRCTAQNVSSPSLQVVYLFPPCRQRYCCYSVIRLPKQGGRRGRSRKRHITKIFMYTNHPRVCSITFFFFLYTSLCCRTRVQPVKLKSRTKDTRRKSGAENGSLTRESWIEHTMYLLGEQRWMAFFFVEVHWRCVLGSQPLLV